MIVSDLGVVASPLRESLPDGVDSERGTRHDTERRVGQRRHSLRVHILAKSDCNNPMNTVEPITTTLRYARLPSCQSEEPSMIQLISHLSLPEKAAANGYSKGSVFEGRSRTGHRCFSSGIWSTDRCCRTAFARSELGVNDIADALPDILSLFFLGSHL